MNSPLKPRSTAPAIAARRLRAMPSCRGGASSMLRLSQPVAPRLPGVRSLSSWLQQAATPVESLSPAPLFVVGASGLR